jgi:hypothetical protein
MPSGHDTDDSNFRSDLDATAKETEPLLASQLERVQMQYTSKEAKLEIIAEDEDELDARATLRDPRVSQDEKNNIRAKDRQKKSLADSTRVAVARAEHSDWLERQRKAYELEQHLEGGQQQKRRKNPKPPNGPRVGQSKCATCMSREAQIATGTSAFVPIFLKFHKVGSGTVAEIMRRHCNSIAKRVSPAGSEYPTFPWRGGSHCGLGPHEHATMDIYHSSGMEGLELCSQQKAPVRAYTILRDPVEKFLSGIYFWKRAIPADLAPKLLDPGAITVADVDRLANEVYKRGEPNAGRAGPLLQYSYVLGRLKMAARDSPTAVQTAASCRKLEDEFTVGVTEQMDSFLVLVALENKWPLEEMCYYRSHVNKARPKREDFQPEVRSNPCSPKSSNK